MKMSVEASFNCKRKSSCDRNFNTETKHDFGSHCAYPFCRGPRSPQ